MFAKILFAHPGFPRLSLRSPHGRYFLLRKKHALRARSNPYRCKLASKPSQIPKNKKSQKLLGIPGIQNQFKFQPRLNLSAFNNKVVRVGIFSVCSAQSRLVVRMEKVFLSKLNNLVVKPFQKRSVSF